MNIFRGLKILWIFAVTYIRYRSLIFDILLCLFVCFFFVCLFFVFFFVLFFFFLGGGGVITKGPLIL